MQFYFRFLFLTVVILHWLSCSLFSQQVTYDWKHVIPGSGYTSLWCMDTDSSGNMYVGGRLDSTVSFVDTTVNNADITGFLAKFTSDGDMVWFKQFEYSRCVYSMCFDSENNLYISGSYDGKVRIDDTLLYTHDIDTTFFGMFLAKFDTDGNRIWAKTTGGTFYYESGYGKLKQMTIDKDDNLVIVGFGIDDLEYFDTTGTYDPTDSIWVTSPWPPHWEYPSYYSNYMVKYNKEGQKLWIRDMGGYNQHYLAISTDYSNNILLTGYFWDDYPFVVDTITLYASGGENLFIIKYNPYGHLLWAQRGGSMANVNKGFDIISDTLNNVYLSGQISGGSIEFGGIVYTHHCYLNAFITKYNDAGIVQWVNYMPSQVYYENGLNNALSLGIYNGFIYVTGFFYDSLILGFTNMISMMDPSGMFLKYDSTGNLHDAAMDLVSDNVVYPIEFSISDGNNYVAGNKAYFTSSWKWDLFLGKIAEPFLTGVEFVIVNNNIDCIYYPNPCQDILYIDFYDFSHKIINVYDINGKLITTLSQNTIRYEIDVRDYLPGVYLLQVQTSDRIITKKIIKN